MAYAKQTVKRITATKTKANKKKVANVKPKSTRIKKA